jgi:hypothetical protein
MGSRLLAITAWTAVVVLTTGGGAALAADTQPPTTPGNLRNAGNVGDPRTQIRIAWTASTDDVGVTGYDVTRDGRHVDTRPATGLDHASSGLTCGTSYTFTVRAKDAAGKFSEPATLTTAPRHARRRRPRRPHLPHRPRRRPPVPAHAVA